MKYSTIALSMLSVLFVVSCSEQNTNKPVATSSAAATSPVKQAALAKDLPAEIKGLPSEAAGQCAVDTVNKPVKEEVIAIHRAAGLNIWGWALDERSASVPSAVFLYLKGKESYYAQLNRSGERGDLAKAYGKPEFINAGYGSSVDISSLPVGRYEVFVIQKGENKSLVCPTNRKLVLND